MRLQYCCERCFAFVDAVSKEFPPFNWCIPCWKKQRAWAWKVYRAALKSGELVKPAECSACDRTSPEYKIIGHHTDYTEPLQVEWVCERCHGRAHREAKRKAAA